MKDSQTRSLEELIEKLNDDRAWLLKNIDNGNWSKLRNELAELERELSKFILRVKEFNSEIKN
tara:strand:+ start:214 stop:402 length:189 start_codon:yes stop_codon:yes gene_type:complete